MTKHTNACRYRHCLSVNETHAFIVIILFFSIHVSTMKHRIYPFSIFICINGAYDYTSTDVYGYGKHEYLPNNKDN